MMNLVNGGIKHRPQPERVSYAVKLARAQARQEQRCPGITKKGEPCRRALGHCPWHEDA